MSKSGLAVGVTVAFTLATTLSPNDWLSDWRPVLATLSWAGLAIATVWWLVLHNELSKGWIRMTLVIVGVILIGIGLLGFRSSKPEPPTPSQQTVSPPVKEHPVVSDQTPKPLSPVKPQEARTKQKSTGDNSPNIRGSHNTVTYNQAQIAPEDRIRTIKIEFRLTMTIRDGVELPPSSVDFMPIGSGSDAQFIGPSGPFTLSYVSPTVFRRLESNRIVVINIFTLGSASELMGRPIASLGSLEQLHAPGVTIGANHALFDTMTLAEASVSVNGRSPWYYAWKLPQGAKFQPGPILKFPLADPSNPFRP